MSQVDQHAAGGKMDPSAGPDGREASGAAGRPVIAGFQEVFRAERVAIAARRNRVFASGTFDEGNVRHDLVGLALSGGGIRSAVFNLGLLQALYERKLLRFVDYLSTVSGGGYIGSYLSLLASKSLPEDARNYFERYRREGRNNPLRQSSVAGEQTRRTNRIGYKGNYLLNPTSASNRYLIGLFFILMFVGSGLVAACSAAAIIWRLFDSHWWRDRMALLDLSWDLYAPLWPILLCLGAWLIAWHMTYLAFYRRPDKEVEVEAGTGSRRNLRRSQRLRRLGAWNRWVHQWESWRRWSYVGLISSVLISVAILVGNGDISLGFLGDLLGQTEGATVPSSLRTVLIALVGIGLLPLLRTQAVIRSGEQPSRPWQAWLYRITLFALVAGVPLVIIGFIGKENVSGFAAGRKPDLLASDIMDWRAFHAWLDEPDGLWQKYGVKEPPRSEDDAHVPVDLAGVKQTLGHHLRGQDAALKQIRASEFWKTDGDGAWDRWNIPQRLLRRTWLLLGSVFTNNSVSDYLGHKEQAEARQEIILDWLNRDPLENPVFLEFIAASPGVRSPGQPDAGEPHQAVADRTADQKQKALRGLDKIVADRAAVLKEGKELADLWGRARAGGTTAWDRLSVKRLNRLLLEAVYPEHIRERSEILRVILVDKDQWARLWWLLASGVIFVTAAVGIDMNFTSMHRFYQDRLAEAYLGPTGKWKLLKDLDTTGNGGPYHLIVATLNLLGFRRDPYRRRQLPFVFSQLYCGSGLKEDPGADRRSGAVEYKRTDQYLGGTLDLATAMAVSGAAVGPTSARSLSLLLVMAVLNFRLGQWFPRPKTDDAPTPITPWRLLREFLRQPGERWRYGFISDGGHHDNLGLEQLLARRCRLIIVSDVSQDEQYEFADLADLVRRARVDHGIRLTNFADTEAIDTDPLRPDEAGISRRHFVIARIEYPKRRTGKDTFEDEDDGILLYLKPTFTGDEDVDLQQFRRDNSAFPHDATIDQFYDERKVESYRQLGYHMGEALSDYLHRRIEFEFRDEPLGQLVEKLRQASDRLRAMQLRRKRRGGRRVSPETRVLASVLEKILADPDPKLREAAVRYLEEVTESNGAAS